ncbi:hypothetical protein HDU99_002958 [Rhizoclosmatium hyalinum]|nr:hypothetical protein HDU99_002958 [Rhizoclosmatium hyalinum]
MSNPEPVAEPEPTEEEQRNQHLLAPISLSLNPKGTIFLGYETPNGSMYLALSTGTFEKPETLPVPTSVLSSLVVLHPDQSLHPKQEISAESMSIPLTEQEWLFARELVNKSVPGTFPESLSYPDFLRNTLKVYLDNFDEYEALSFPMAFRKSFKSFADQPKAERGEFGAYVSRKFRESSQNPMVLDWVAWAGTILHALKVLEDLDPRAKEFGLYVERKEVTVQDSKKQSGVAGKLKPKKGVFFIPVDIILMISVLVLLVAWFMGWIRYN